MLICVQYTVHTVYTIPETTTCLKKSMSAVWLSQNTGHCRRAYRGGVVYAREPADCQAVFWIPNDFFSSGSKFDPDPDPTLIQIRIQIQIRHIFKKAYSPAQFKLICSPRSHHELHQIKYIHTVPVLILFRFLIIQF